MIEALIGYRVIDVSCGSGDAQTLCITDDDSGKYEKNYYKNDFMPEQNLSSFILVWSFGDGDYGKLGKNWKLKSIFSERTT